MTITLHKSQARSEPPIVSVVLLDWSCREHFQALRWLNEQDCDRGSYELIWVELHERVVPQAIEHADVVITCGQSGTYHKHEGYNVGLLNATGRIVTVCDSDAVFPRNFISSVIDSFNQNGAHILMHYEYRTASLYPEHLTDIEELENFEWQKLHPNVGACMSVLRNDAIRLGGFDEDASYRGYLCGPYDLGWRLINLGHPEFWNDPQQCALWHFAHPEPNDNPDRFAWKAWREITYPHVEYHALTAVEAFSAGRLLPLVENPAIHKLRLQRRRIGTKYEERYAQICGPEGLSRDFVLRRRAAHFGDMCGRIAATNWSAFKSSRLGRRIKRVLRNEK